MKQTHNMYNDKLQKNNRKRKAARAKTFFYTEILKARTQQFPWTHSKFWEKTLEPGKTEGPTSIKPCMGLLEKSKQHKERGSNSHIAEGIQDSKKHLGRWLIQYRVTG